MKKITLKFDKFILIILLLIFVFLPIIFLSIPTFYNYQSLIPQIEKKIYSQFKIYTKINSKISYKPFPSPHYEIEKISIKLSEIDISPIIENAKIKIFLPIKNIYSKSLLEFNSIEIEEANINLQFSDLRKIRKHLYYAINKPIELKKIKLFVKNNQNQVIIISPLNNVSYKLNEKTKKKIFNIDGKIFDLDLESRWERDYKSPKSSYHNIHVKNPNIFIKNQFLNIDKNNFSGESFIKFLDNELSFDYKYSKQKISISSPNENENIKIFSEINLKPFDFDLSLEVYKKKINFFTDHLFRYILSLDKTLLGNLNGSLKIFIKEADNPIISEGILSLDIKEKSIEIIEARLQLKKIGIIRSEIKYIEDNKGIKFFSRNKLQILDHIEFAKTFQLSSKKTKNIKEITFDLQKSMNSDNLELTNVNIINLNGTKNIKEKFELKNIQVLRSILGKII
tara:strand:- start:2638 stop:3996 length:1359 start_codon:yes stop_codon:yes gene_type:complete